jgi:hypothetical protein
VIQKRLLIRFKDKNPVSYAMLCAMLCAMNALSASML